jgi:hypothetical protein
MEQRSQVQESEDRQSLERSFLGEVERLQREVEQAKQGAEMSTQCGESLKREVSVHVDSAMTDDSFTYITLFLVSWNMTRVLLCCRYSH